MVTWKQSYSQHLVCRNEYFHIYTFVHAFRIHDINEIMSHIICDEIKKEPQSLPKNVWDETLTYTNTRATGETHSTKGPAGTYESTRKIGFHLMCGVIWDISSGV